MGGGIASHPSNFCYEIDRHILGTKIFSSKNCETINSNFFPPPSGHCFHATKSSHAGHENARFSKKEGVRWEGGRPRVVFMAGRLCFLNFLFCFPPRSRATLTVTDFVGLVGAASCLLLFCLCY